MLRWLLFRFLVRRRASAAESIREPLVTEKVKILVHSSCEIEDFVETHLCKLSVILRSRVCTGCVSSLRI